MKLRPAMITHDLLLILGFRPLPFQPNRYKYHGMKGRLVAGGQFFFDGFSLPIKEPEDLQFMLVLIDQLPEGGGSAPFSEN